MKINIHKFRNFGIIFYLLLCFCHLSSQTNEFVDEDFPGSNLLGVYEVDGGLMIAVSNWLNPADTGVEEFAMNLYKIELDKLSSNFKVELVHRLEMENNYQVISLEYIDETNEWICVMANNLTDIGPKDFRVQVYSTDFLPLTFQEAEIAGNPNSFYIDTYEGKTALLGYVFEPGNDKLVYAEYRHSQAQGLQPIMVGQSSPKKTFWVTSMNFDERTGNMLVFYYLGISILDSTLYQVENHDLLKIMTNDHGTALMEGEYYYSHSARDSAWDDGRRKMVLHKYDTSFTILKADTLGWPSQDNYPFIVSSMDIRNGSILIGGNLDGPFNGLDFYIRKKKFYLAKYDLDLNQEWYKEFGGDRAYIMNGLKMIENGGAFAFGFISDSSTAIRYAYIMYVNENGEIVSSKEIPISDGPPLRVVNPGSNQLTILNPDGLDARIVLTTMDGIVVLNRNLSPDLNNFDLSTLPTGIYPYVFYLDDKPVKSGKWVKKE